jgi:hypothetical protein
VISQNSPVDPAVHALAITCAKRCVWIIQACLREEERIEAVREFYGVLVEELSKKPTSVEEV